MMRKTTAVALLAATAAALTYAPTRRWIASLLIDTAIHLDNGGADPGPTPAQAERIRRGVLAHVEVERRKAERNGAHPI